MQTAWLLMLAGTLAAPGDLAVDHNICRDLPTQLNAIMSAPALEEAKVGVYVHQLDDDSPLFAFNPDESLVPASNIKLISTAAALHYLGTDYRFKTEVLGRLDQRGVVNGPLYLRGNGDPWLVPERVWFLANRLYYLGVRQVRGDIIVDDSYFDGPRLSLGWEQDRSSYAYMAPRGAVSVGFNTLVVHVYPGEAPGQPAEIMVEPKSGYAKIESSVVTVGRGRSRLTIDVEPDSDSSIVRVSGRINVREAGRGYYRRVDNPPIYAGEVIKQAMRQVGINVRGSSRVRRGVAPEGAENIAQLASPRLSELINRVNKHSNNFMAEQIALATGAEVYGPPGTWDKAQAAIERFLQEEVGLQKGKFSVRNASGLHDVNVMSSHQFVRVLAYMYQQPRLRPEYISSMSVAGTSGTLSSRMRESDAQGLLRAKTGTLSISSALSGYVVATSGETVAFSILINDYTAPISEIWAAQDEIGTALAAYDSRCTPNTPVFSNAARSGNNAALP